MRRLTIGGLVAVITLALVLGPLAHAPAPNTVAEANAGTQWNASYYNNTSLSGSPVLQRIDDQINFNWGTGSPGGSVNADNFSVRWTKTVNFDQGGPWTFRVGADDGIRMWIDVTPIIDEWHGNPEGYRVYEVTLDGLTAGNHDLKVEYYEATGDARATVEWFYGGSPGGTIGATTYRGGTWQGQYYNNKDLSGSPVLTRSDNEVVFNWANGSPGSGVNADNFSARWTTTFNFPQAGRWRFVVGADDGVRMTIDVTRILDEWHGNPEGFRTYETDVYALTAGNHDLTVEYYEETGNAGIKVEWYYVGDDGAVDAGGGGGAPVPPPDPPARVWAAVTADNVNVRTGPGRGNPVVTQIFYPEDYRVLGTVGDLSWLQIDLKNGTSGWVSNEWVYLYAVDPEDNKDTTGGGQPDFVDDIPRIDVEIAPPAPLPDPETSPRVILTGRATDTLNLRDGPSVYASKVISSIPQGATFDVEARNGNGSWYLIDYQGVRGWVSALYVTLVDGYVRDLVVSSEVVPAPERGSVVVPENEQGEPVTVTGRTTADLTLRGAASIRGDDLGEVPEGTELVIEGRNTTGAWYLVNFQGVQGWIYSPFVSLLDGQVSDLQIR